MQAKIPYLSYGMVDESGTRSTMRINIKPSVPLSTAQAGCNSTRVLLDAMTDCPIDRQSVVFPFIEDTPTDPDINASIYTTGVFIFGTTDLDQFAVIEVPGISPACILTTGPTAGVEIDRLNSDVAAFISAVIGSSYISIFGYDITELLAAFIETRR